jgi:hypothetical protein
LCNYNNNTNPNPWYYHTPRNPPLQVPSVSIWPPQPTIPQKQLDELAALINEFRKVMEVVKARQDLVQRVAAIEKYLER